VSDERPDAEKRNWGLEMAMVEGDRQHWKKRAEEAEARLKDRVGHACDLMEELAPKLFGHYRSGVLRRAVKVLRKYGDR